MVWQAHKNARYGGVCVTEHRDGAYPPPEKMKKSAEVSAEKGTQQDTSLSLKVCACELTRLLL